MKQGCLEYKTIITSVADFVITFFKEKVKGGISGGIKGGISGGIKEGIKLLLYTIKTKNNGEMDKEIKTTGKDCL
jgi:hypothetical protein